MPHPPLLSIVIPAYNEEIRLPSTLSSIGSYLVAKGLDAEIIVVDDGSTDGTVRVVEQARQGGLGRARVEGPGSPATEGVRFDPVSSGIRRIAARATASDTGCSRRVAPGFCSQTRTCPRQ